jgi:uncharacterized phage protein (TIGR01671 family)
MREIKFRVWDIKNKKWIDSWWLQFGSYNRLITDIGCYINLSEHSHDYIIQQFTGLKDKTGKEIYEGDILRMRSANPPQEFTYQISFCEKDARYILHDKKTSWFAFTFLWSMWEIVVVGNIFENPELLK